MIEAEDLSCASIISSLQGAFGRTQCTTFRRCIIAPLLKQGVLAAVRCQRFSPLLNQRVQFLLGGFAVKEEGQQVHHIVIGQQSRLTQKLLQHPGTSTKPVGSLAPCQAFPLMLQLLLSVLGGNQLFLGCGFLAVQLFQFFIYGGQAPF